MHVRTITLGLAAATLLSGCVTKGTFRREMEARKTELASERAERIAGDSAIRAEVAAQIAALRGELDTLRTTYGARITTLEQGIQFAMPVTFAFDDATVRPEDEAMLDRFASVVQQHYGSSLVTIEGFADPAGSTRYNTALSRRRAEAVRGYLTSKGLTADQLKAIGYGETRLVNAGAERDEPGAEENRRVVFVVETRGAAAQRTVAAMQGGE